MYIRYGFKISSVDVKLFGMVSVVDFHLNKYYSGQAAGWVKTIVNNNNFLTYQLVTEGIVHP